MRNPFLFSETNKLPVTNQETLLDVSSDRGLRIKFDTSTLTQFWVCVKQEHPDLGQKALESLLPFASTYLCEATFSAMSVIKTKQRNRLSLEKSLITAVASLSPRMTKFLIKNQFTGSPLYLFFLINVFISVNLFANVCLSDIYVILCTFMFMCLTFTK